MYYGIQFDHDFAISKHTERKLPHDYVVSKCLWQEVIFIICNIIQVHVCKAQLSTRYNNKLLLFNLLQAIIAIISSSFEISIGMKQLFCTKNL